MLSLFSSHWRFSRDGVGQQGHRDPGGGEWTVRWSVHAQEDPEAAIPLREERQGEIVEEDG